MIFDSVSIDHEGGEIFEQPVDRDMVKMNRLDANRLDAEDLHENGSCSEILARPVHMGIMDGCENAWSVLSSDHLSADGPQQGLAEVIGGLEPCHHSTKFVNGGRRRGDSMDRHGKPFSCCARRGRGKEKKSRVFKSVSGAS